MKKGTVTMARVAPPLDEAWTPGRRLAAATALPRLLFLLLPEQFGTRFAEFGVTAFVIPGRSDTPAVVGPIRRQGITTMLGPRVHDHRLISFQLAPEKRDCTQDNNQASRTTIPTLPTFDIPYLPPPPESVSRRRDPPNTRTTFHKAQFPTSFLLSTFPTSLRPRPLRFPTFPHLISHNLVLTATPKTKLWSSAPRCRKRGSVRLLTTTKGTPCNELVTRSPGRSAGVLALVVAMPLVLSHVFEGEWGLRALTRASSLSLNFVTRCEGFPSLPSRAVTAFSRSCRVGPNRCSVRVAEGGL
jgi:hypothetical protein